MHTLNAWQPPTHAQHSTAQHSTALHCTAHLDRVLRNRQREVKKKQMRKGTRVKSTMGVGMEEKIWKGTRGKESSVWKGHEARSQESPGAWWWTLAGLRGNLLLGAKKKARHFPVCRFGKVLCVVVKKTRLVPETARLLAKCLSTPKKHIEKMKSVDEKCEKRGSIRCTALAVETVPPLTRAKTDLDPQPRLTGNTRTTAEGRVGGPVYMRTVHAWIFSAEPPRSIMPPTPVSQGCCMAPCTRSSASVAHPQ